MLSRDLTVEFENELRCFNLVNTYLPVLVALSNIGALLFVISNLHLTDNYERALDVDLLYRKRAKV